MSQHWEDRDAEDRRAYLLVLFGADPRDVRRRTYGREVAIGVVIGLGISAVTIWGLLFR
jgi:hypothetical protein